jgi:hypothetical protein
MKEDEGPGDDGMSELIADLGKGQVPSMLNLMCAQYVMKRIQDGRMQTPTSTFLKRY